MIPLPSPKKQDLEKNNFFKSYFVTRLFDDLPYLIPSPTPALSQNLWTVGMLRNHILVNGKMKGISQIWIGVGFLRGGPVDRTKRRLEPQRAVVDCGSCGSTSNLTHQTSTLHLKVAEISDTKWNVGEEIKANQFPAMALILVDWIAKESLFLGNSICLLYHSFAIYGGLNYKSMGAQAF